MQSLCVALCHLQREVEIIRKRLRRDWHGSIAMNRPAAHCYDDLVRDTDLPVPHQENMCLVGRRLFTDPKMLDLRHFLFLEARRSSTCRVRASVVP